MNKMGRQAIRTMFDGRSQVCDITKILMRSLKTAKKRQQLHTWEVRGLVAFCFYPPEEKIVSKLCFLSIFQVQTVLTPIS